MNPTAANVRRRVRRVHRDPNGNGASTEATVPLKSTIKLDIACGQNKQEGFVGIDVAPCPGVDIVHDLWTYPWPIEDSSVETAFCSHYIEHIPAEYIWLFNGRSIDPLHKRPDPEKAVDRVVRKDALLAFFDEVWRVLVPEGQITIICPRWGSIRCWQDPTHRRAISENTFLYTWKWWREQNKLDHYNVECDFDFTYGFFPDPEWGLRSDEARTFGSKHYLNVLNDIQCTLTKKVGR